MYSKISCAMLMLLFLMLLNLNTDAQHSMKALIKENMQFAVGQYKLLATGGSPE